MTATFDTIAAFVRAPDVPDATLDFAATLLIDTLGVAAGAAHMDAGRIARNHAARFLAPGDGTAGTAMLFDGRTASIPGAAFALATQIDNLDAHDGYNPTKGHIGCAVVPALFAFASRLPDLSGPDALRALAMSYEVSARAALSLHASVSDYHTSGAWNALGVAALGWHLTDAGDPETLRHALGIAEYHGPRSQMMREIANPSMLHDGSGMGALTGCMAVLMARDGFLGAPAITCEAPDAAPFWADLGTVWTTDLNYIKPYPICRWAHAAIDAVRSLMRTHDLHPGNVTRIDIDTFAESAQLFAGMPATTSQAQYSLAFACATMLQHGAVGPEHVTGAALSDPAVAAIVDRIHVHEDPDLSARFPVERIAAVRIQTTDGTTHDSGVTTARGGPEAPMSRAEVHEKFTAMTRTTLPSARADALWAMRDRLTAPDAKFADLAALATAAP